MLRNDAGAHPRNIPHDQAAQPAADRADRESGRGRAAEAGGALGREVATWQAVAAGQWVTTVELVPPRGYDLSSTVAKSRTLRERGVTAINIPDGPRASARISPLITAERILREAQIEPILHFCCRDRNLIGMQADLLACAACGVRNILFVTGDPPKLGDYPHATGVFDADSIGMAAVQKRLNQGVDLGGQPIDPQTFAVIGVGLDPRRWIASARSTVSGRRSNPGPSLPSRSRSSTPTPCCGCSTTCSTTAFPSWRASGR